MDHMTCYINKDYCSNTTCKLSFISRRVKKLNWACNLTTKLDTIYSHVKLYYRYRAGYKPFLIDVTADYCTYQNNQLGNAIFDLIAEVFKNYTKNIWRPCPFLPAYLSINDLPLTSRLVKNIFVPAGDYRLTIDTLIGIEKTNVATLSLFISIPGGRTLEDDKMG